MRKEIPCFDFSIYSIELVQDLNHEAAATVSGGALDLSSLRNGKDRA
ncbi:hypothetical protein [Nostoc sp. PCC 9305]